jgi:hypothetical protein
MMHGQYDDTAAFATTDEALRFGDVERDLFPDRDAVDRDMTSEELEPWMCSAAKRMPAEPSYGRFG